MKARILVLAVSFSIFTCSHADPARQLENSALVVTNAGDASGTERDSASAGSIPLSKEEEQAVATLRQLPEDVKGKVRRSLQSLEHAILVSATSGESEATATASRQAIEALTEATTDLPDGALRGSLIVAEKAVEDFFLLRLDQAGLLNLERQDVVDRLANISSRYELATVPKHDRAATVLNFARASHDVARHIASLAGFLQQSPAR